MHSKWNLLPNLTRTIRQALETVGQTWMDGGGVSGGGDGKAGAAEVCCTPQVAA